MEGGEVIVLLHIVAVSSGPVFGKENTNQGTESCSKEELMEVIRIEHLSLRNRNLYGWPCPTTAPNCYFQQRRASGLWMQAMMDSHKICKWVFTLSNKILWLCQSVLTQTYTGLDMIKCCNGKLIVSLGLYVCLLFPYLSGLLISWWRKLMKLSWSRKMVVNFEFPAVKYPIVQNTSSQTR